MQWLFGKLLPTFVLVKALEVVCCLMLLALFSLRNSSYVREKDKALAGGVWNGFLLGYVRGQMVPWRFCGAPDGDGHLCWECTYPPLVEIRENPVFHDLMRMDKAHWPRCLLWHGWLPMLSGVNGCFGNALFLRLLRFVKILSFMIS